MEQEFKTVARFNDLVSAEITAGMLRENGIPAYVFGQSSPYPAINATIDFLAIKVNAEDYEDAMALLEMNEKTE